MIQQHSVTIDDLNMTISTGDLAQLASGSVTITVGETCVFVSATAANTVRKAKTGSRLPLTTVRSFPRLDGFPAATLARSSANGKGNPDLAAMRSPLPTSVSERLLNEVQIIGFLLSTDKSNEPDISMINGASAALAISDIPWNGPIGAVRVGRIDGEFVVNPTVEDQYSSDLDLIYVGTKTDMLMIEGAAQLPEDDFIAALEFAHEAIQPLIAGIEELVSIAGKEKAEFPLVVLDPEIKTFVEGLIGEGIASATRIGDKQERNAAIDELKDKAEEALKKLGEDAYNPASFRWPWKSFRK